MKLAILALGTCLLTFPVSTLAAPSEAATKTCLERQQEITRSYEADMKINRNEAIRKSIFRIYKKYNLHAIDKLELESESMNQFKENSFLKQEESLVYRIDAGAESIKMDVKVETTFYGLLRITGENYKEVDVLGRVKEKGIKCKARSVFGQEFSLENRDSHEPIVKFDDSTYPELKTQDQTLTIKQ